MKIIRQKKAHKILIFYSTHFGYREPFQILVDGTFCQAALQAKVEIEEQLQKYLQNKIKLVTTQCIILETENLGPTLTGATIIVKRFIVHKCGHEGKPVSGSTCIKSMLKGSRYIVATQDRSLQNFLRKVPGQAILYLHKSAPVLETPSESTKKSVQNKNSNMFSNLEANIKKLKKAEGIQNDDKKKIAAKRKHPKNPNPLSCKKKKQKIKKQQSTPELAGNKK